MFHMKNIIHTATSLSPAAKGSYLWREVLIAQARRPSLMAAIWHFICFQWHAWVTRSDLDSCNPPEIMNICACAYLERGKNEDTCFRPEKCKIVYLKQLNKKKNVFPVPFCFLTWILEYTSLTSKCPSSSFSDSIPTLIWNHMVADTYWQPDLSP